MHTHLRRFETGLLRNFSRLGLTCSVNSFPFFFNELFGVFFSDLLPDLLGCNHCLSYLHVGHQGVFTFRLTLN